jgi:osmotically-inducible protein OsmY
MPIKDIIHRVLGHERRETGFDRKKMHPLEGAGRPGWDSDQNRAYGEVYGDRRGPSTYVGQGEVRHFYGIGSKNYRRSDERIREDINDALTDDRLVDASHIEVQVREGEVILTGSVESRISKRRAEDVAESIRGVKHMENRLKISQNQ